jgi:nitroreductase
MARTPEGSLDAPLPVPDAVLKRRNVRHFRPDPLAPGLLDRLVELAVKAPSSWNLQPWRIVVVRDAAQRERLYAACFGQVQVREAPVSFVFAISQGGWRSVMDDVVRAARERGAWEAGYADAMPRLATRAQEALGERLREYNVKDALIAATHLVLSAESMGLGTCFMNGYDEARVKEVVGAGADPDVGVALVLSVGYAERRGRDPGRLPLERVVFAERLDAPWRGAANQRASAP